LVGLSVFADPNNVATSSDLKGVGVIFYTAEDPDEAIDVISKAAVTLQPGESYTFGDEIVGCWFDSGLFAQVVGNSGAIGSGSDDDKVVINVSYVPREFYSPAYPDGEHQAQYYWGCNRSEDFKENWYEGAGGSLWEDTGSASTPDGGVASTFEVKGPTLLDDLFLVDQDGGPIASEVEDYIMVQ